MIPKIIHQVAPADKKRWSKEWFVCDESWNKIKGYKRKIWNDRDDIDNFIKKYDPYIFDLLNKFEIDNLTELHQSQHTNKPISRLHVTLSRIGTPFQDIIQYW